MSLPSVSVQPARLIGLEVVLKSSIHSSLEDAAVPAQAISLMTTARAGNGVSVRVGVVV